MSTKPDGGVSRRNVITAAAWSVPVMAVAVAAPMASASGDALVAEWNPATLALHRGPGTSTFTVTNAGSTALVGFTVLIRSLGGEVDVSDRVAGAGWSWSTGGGGTGTFTYSGRLAPGAATPAATLTFVSEDPVGTGTTTFVATPMADGFLAQQAAIRITYDQVEP